MKTETNSAELFIRNRATLHTFGESISNGPTIESVKLAEENVKNANALLAQVGQEYVDRLLAETKRSEARATAIAETATE